MLDETRFKSPVRLALCRVLHVFMRTLLCWVLQIKQETDEFVREREEKTHDMEVRQRRDLEQFDLHSLTLGLGAVTDMSPGDVDSPAAVHVRDSSLSLLSAASPGSPSSAAPR